jgi:hypothetical protein
VVFGRGGVSGPNDRIDAKAPTLRTESKPTSPCLATSFLLAPHRDGVFVGRLTPFGAVRDLDKPEYECEGSYIGEGGVKNFDDLIIPAESRSQDISCAGPFVGPPNYAMTTPP